VPNTEYVGVLLPFLVTGHPAVRVIAKRLDAGFLAAAKEHFSGSLGDEPHWLESGSLMFAVAEGLFFTFATGAPQIGAPSDNVDDIWRQLSAHWFHFGIGHDR
jgi:hypothetical protein